MFDIGRKKKEDGIYFIGQNADDVTGSCTYIKYNGKKILLECGLFQNNNYLDSYNMNQTLIELHRGHHHPCNVSPTLREPLNPCAQQCR